MRADDIRKDQMRYKEIEPNGISPNSTALGHDQPLWLPLVYSISGFFSYTYHFKRYFIYPYENNNFYGMANPPPFWKIP